MSPISDLFWVQSLSLGNASPFLLAVYPAVTDDADNMHSLVALSRSSDTTKNVTEARQVKCR